MLGLALATVSAAPRYTTIFSATLDGKARAKTERALADLQPGASIEVPLAIALDKDALLREQSARPVVVRVEVPANAGELRVEAARAIAAIAHGRRALTRKQPESIAAFVTHRDAQLVDWARHAHGAVPGSVARSRARGADRVVRVDGEDEIRARPAQKFRASELDYVLFPLRPRARAAAIATISQCFMRRSPKR